MDSLLEKLDTKFNEWNPQVVLEVRERLIEIIDLADLDAPDISRSREVEQSVLDLLDEPPSR